jgi:hypothetical protein
MLKTTMLSIVIPAEAGIQSPFVIPAKLVLECFNRGAGIQTPSLRKQGTIQLELDSPGSSPGQA